MEMPEKNILKMEKINEAQGTIISNKDIQEEIEEEI